MKTVSKRLIVLGAAGALALATSAQADVLFNNFGGGDTYNTGTGWTISDGAPINTDNDQGDAFTVSGGNFFLTSIELAIGFVVGQNRVFIDFYDDNGGEPGTILESATIDNQMGQFGNNNPLIVANYSGSTALNNGEQYWVVASSDTDSWLAWNWNSIGDVGPHASRQDGGAWNLSDGVFTGPPGPGDDNTRGAFRVNGDAIPAPGALALLGIAGLGMRRRRR